MEEKRTRWLIGLQLVLLTLVVVNMLMTAGLVRRPLPEQPERRCSEAHESVPMAFITGFPECADHLLHTMGVTNIHVQRFNGTLPGDEIEESPAIVAWRERMARMNATAGNRTP